MWKCLFTPDILNVKRSSTSLDALPDAAALISRYRCGSSVHHILQGESDSGAKSEEKARRIKAKEALSIDKSLKKQKTCNI